MTRKYLQQRRQQAVELGKREAAARCAYCRIALPTPTWSLQDFTTGKKFCSQECSDAHDEREAMEARR